MTRLRTGALALLVSAAFAGCGDSNPSDPGPGTILTLSIESGDAQVGAIGVVLPAPLIVLVEDQNGDPVSGTTVTWSLASAAGSNSSLSSDSTPTGTDGRASVSFTLGDAAGTYEVRASVTGSSATFSAEATASGALSVVSGNGQVGMTGMPAARPLVVKAVGTGGVGVPGVEVTFAVTQSEGAGAAVNPATATTGANGEASTVLTFGDANGVVLVSAGANSSTVSLSGYACGGDASASVLDLQPGQGVTLSAGDVGCVQLPAPQGDEAYEVVATTVPEALGTSNMMLAITGAGQGSPSPQSAASAAQLNVTQAGAPSSLQYQWDQRMRAVERDMLPTIRAAASRDGFGLMSVPTVGEQRTIKFSCVGFGGDGSFGNAPEELTVEAIVVSDKAVIWEDVQNPGAFDLAQYGEIATTFDDVIYAVDTTYFGSPGDIDGDGRVSLVYSSEVNRMTDELAGTYNLGFIGGFFCPADLGFPTFNNAEMFYLVVPDPDGSYVSDNSSLSVALVRRTTDKVVAHEFQHMINAQTGSGGAQSLWINEGLSHLAEEVVGHAVGGFSPGTDLDWSTVVGTEAWSNYYQDNFVNLDIYMSAPADTGGLVLWEDPLTQNTFPMRGAAWSFLRYLLDRFEDPATEWQATRSVIRFSSGCTGADLQCFDSSARDAIEDRFGASFPDLVAEWNAMLAVEDRADVGGPLDAKFELTSWRLRSIYSPYPLGPTFRDLGAQGLVPAELFTTRTRFVRLTGSAAAGVTGLRLMEGGSGADLQSGVVPRLTIVRTN
jgi:hypothetical protein